MLIYIIAGVVCLIVGLAIGYAICKIFNGQIKADIAEVKEKVAAVHAIVVNQPSTQAK
jgi:uncharacterized protein YneF (UPF0154 family)